MIVTAKKKLLANQIAKNEYEEREKRRSTRFSIPPMEAATLGALLTPAGAGVHQEFTLPPQLAASSQFTDDKDRDYFAGVGSELYPLWCWRSDQFTFCFLTLHTGVQVWRIEGKTPVSIGTSEVIKEAKLKTGDCYIFLHVCDAH